MNKAELTPEQAGEREAFVRTLAAAGWNTGTWEELFESGMTLTPEAQAEFQNEGFDLHAGYDAASGSLLLRCAGREEPLELLFRAYPRAGLEDLLGQLVSWQDRLTPDTYPEFVKALANVSDPLLLDTPDGPVQLS